ncbi:MAG: prepilin-type N-terminal cleavage/methylation domain-containing protein [Candidatus Omnitrophota bacterium]|jgi:type IV pilus assembly protein PilE
MRKGFTLLELIIVIIIIGVLATLGFVQYSAVIEKARGAEARTVISTLRSQVAAKNMEGATGNIVATDLGIGSGIPNACGTSQTTNYFSYNIVAGCTTTNCSFTATRCTTGGKAPPAPNNGSLRLNWTSSGTNTTDSWVSVGGY